MIHSRKSCACLVHQDRVLAFFHPEANNLQMPKGTIEPGEAAATAVVRELLEESGVQYSGEPELLCELDREVGAEESSFREHELQHWQVFVLHTRELLPERWTHIATGSPDEEGLAFEFFWQPLAVDAPSGPRGFDDTYQHILGALRSWYQRRHAAA